VARVRRRRRRRLVVGAVITSGDVKALQDRVARYRVQLLQTAEAVRAASSRGFDPTGAHSEGQWEADQLDALHWVSEDPAYLFAEAQYARGRDVLANLDQWRDFFAGLDVPSSVVPQPIPVPSPGSSDVFGSLEGMGLLLLAFMALRELR